MFVLLFFSTEGMSTSLLAYRMEYAAKARGLDYRIEAHSVADLTSYAQEADILLMGPQDRFLFNNVKSTYPSKPIIVVDPKYYGSMDGEKVLDTVIKELEKHL